MEKAKIPDAWIQDIPSPPEPQAYTLEAMVQYIIQLQLVNQRHNADKAALREWREK